MKKLLILNLLMLFFVSNAYSKRKPLCGKEQLSEKFSVKYCLYLTDREKNNDIIFFLHGKDRDEASWGSGYGKRVEKYWRKKKLAPPTIISLSFGPRWFLTDFPLAEGAPPLQGLFTDVLMPRFEAKVGGAMEGLRLIMGESMGGYNAIMLFLKRPKLFARAAILCPAIATITPFSSDEEVGNYIKRTGANPKKVYNMLAISKALFKDETTWLRHSPLDLMKPLAGAHSPKLYLTSGERDHYGFHEGTVLFSQGIDRAGGEQVWRPIKGGGHCDNIETKSLAHFLTFEM